MDYLVGGMFREVDLELFYYMIHPRPTLFIISRCPDGKVNIMPASWNMPVSEEPPTVAISVYREAYTYKCLEYSGEASLNVPSWEHLDLAYKLGTTSGHDIDKIKEFNIRLGKAKKINTPIWLDAIGIMEAKVLEAYNVGECRLYIFEIKEIYAREVLFTRYGWNFKKTNLLLHNMGRTFYKIGEMKRAKK
jgi:flavin reductase (DIM6/NTAB) family NADH-FMN oxidoreductase RutF